MYKGKRIAVVVPACNEREMIGRTIETMPGFVDGIFVVDDASTDQTAGIVQDLIDANHRPLHLIRHEKNTGVGGAIYSYGPTLAITNCHFHANDAGGNGGAIYNNNNASSYSNWLTISRCTFTTNVSAGAGGGLYTYRGRILVEDSTFAHNTGTWGGGIYYNVNFRTYR